LAAIWAAMLCGLVVRFENFMITCEAVIIIETAKAVNSIKSESNRPRIRRIKRVHADQTRENLLDPRYPWSIFVNDFLLE
jgi:hypothetical protein